MVVKWRCHGRSGEGGVEVSWLAMELVLFHFTVELLKDLPKLGDGVFEMG